MAGTERILGGCCIYLWQRVDGDGLSLEGITSKVKQLGGKISNKLTKEVTHIIFQRALGASAKELLAEDEDLRLIYRKIEQFGGQLVVVSPLWLRSCETAQARTKEAKFIVPQPKKPIFLDHIDKGENKRKARKSFAARPRELVEVPDFNDALFSSSQQIRELNASPDRQVNEEKPRPVKLRNAGPSSGISAHARRALSEQRGAPAEFQQPAGGKRGMHQLSLDFFIVSKKQKLSVTNVGEASLIAQQPTVAREALDRKCITAEAGAAACVSGRRTDAMPDSKSHALPLVPLTLDPPSEAQQGVALKGGCSATLFSVAEGATTTTSAAAADNICAKPFRNALAPPANPHPISVLPPEVPAPQNADGGADTAGGGSTAATGAAAMEPLMTNLVATEPDATSVVSGPHFNIGSAPLPATLPPGLHMAPRTSSRHRSHSVGGTPLASGLFKSISQLTPLATPKGLTPGSLVMPKLKTQAGGGVTAIASVIPTGSCKAMVRPLPEMDVRAAGSCAIAAIARGSIEEPVISLQREAVPASAQEEVANVVPASIRRSARIRGLLPPTPPPPMQLYDREAPEDLGRGPDGAAVSTTPSIVVVAPRRHMASEGGPGHGFTEGMRKKGCDDGSSRDLNGPTEGLRGDGEGTAGCQRSQLKTVVSALEPLPLSPIADEGAPEGEAAFKSPAGRGHPPNACKSANHLTPAGRTAVASLAQPCIASVARRSARLASSFQDLQLGNRPDLEAKHGVAAKAIAEQQHQEVHDEAKPSFQTASQQPSRSTAPTPGKKPCRETLSLLKDAEAWATEEEHQVASVTCMRTTACKSRRRRQVLNEEEPETQIQREVRVPLLSLQEPVRQREESPCMAPVDLGVRAPTPASAICTRSRTRAAGMMSGTPHVNIVQQQQRQELPGRPSPHPAGLPCFDSGNMQRGNGVCGPSSKPEPAGLHFAPDGSPSPISSALAPPRSGTEAAWQRPGSVTRSRRRALELELADIAAQVPPSTIAKRSRGSFTAALQKAAAVAPSDDAKVEQAGISGGVGAHSQQRAQVPTRGSTTGHTETSPLLELQSIAATAGRNAGSTWRANAPLQPGHTTLQQATFGETVAALSDGGADCGANHGIIGLQPMAAPSVATGGRCLALTCDQIPLRPPRTTRRKRSHETPAVEPPERSSERSNEGSASPVHACRSQGQGVMPNNAFLGEVGDEGAKNHQTSADGNVVGDLIRGIAHDSLLVVPSAAIDQMQSALQPGEAARSTLGPAPRSRLRLRRQVPAPNVPTLDPSNLGQASSVDLQRATLVTAARAISNNRTKTLQKPLPSSSKGDDTKITTAVAPASAAPTTALIPRTRDCPEAAVAAPVEAKDSMPGLRTEIPRQEAFSNGERKVATTRACIVAGERKLAPPSQPCALAAAWRPLHLQQGLFLSLTRPKATATSDCIRWKMPACLGAGSGAKIGRAMSVTAAQPLREPRTASAEASVGSLAPALGQYPRGKEHPMRAGYRYLACTQVGEEMKAMIEQAVKQLGGARHCTPGYEDGHITHLVVGDASVRTLKVLLGIANGAIFVAPSWIEASLAAGKWVPEEQHLVQGMFAAAANAVRACMQAPQQQRGVGEGGGAMASSLSQGGPAGVVVAKPLMGKMVAVHGSQCNISRLADLQKKKAEAETIIKALGGRLGPFRSAELIIVLRGSTTPQTDRRFVKTASEEWLLRLAETHIWQDP